jgi:threonine/homoserine/homoserine lactone efflux protein
MVGELAAFLSISLLLIVIPGPDMALVLRNALLGGRRSGVFTAFGIVTGLFTWTVATSAGIAALLVASEPLFLAVKLGGAAYLLFLSSQVLYGALRGGPQDVTVVPSGGHRITAPVAFRQGAISNLGNPKIAVFFTGFLPQFTGRDDSSFANLFLFGLLFCAIGLLWLSGYAVAVAMVGDTLRRPAIRRVIEGVTGAALVAFGLRLTTAHR